MMTIDTRDTHAYPVMILAAFAAGLAVQYVLNRSRGIRKETAGLTALAGFLCSAGGGLLLTFLTSGGTQVGFSSLGGLAGMYAGGLLVAVAAGHPYYPAIMAQSCTLVLPLMYGLSKIGCLLAGCCRGIAYHGAGSVTYLTDAGTVTVLPVQLMETLSFLVLFALGMALYVRRQKYAVHIVFQLAIWTKLLLDFLRESHAGQVLDVTQLLCLAAAAADAVIWILHVRKQRIRPFS